jgi:hypothetical protein
VKDWSEVIDSTVFLYLLKKLIIFQSKKVRQLIYFFPALFFVGFGIRKNLDPG